jgi:hypothetical protein
MGLALFSVNIQPFITFGRNSWKSDTLQVVTIYGGEGLFGDNRILPSIPVIFSNLLICVPL